MPCMSAQSNIVPVPAPESRRTYSAVQRFTASMSLADWIRKALMIALSVSWRRSWIYASFSLPWSWHMSIVPLFSRQAMFSGFSSTNTPTAFMFGLSNRFKFAAFSVLYTACFSKRRRIRYTRVSAHLRSRCRKAGKTAELDLCHNTPRSSASLAFLSGARINVSPISTASPQPISRSFATSSALLTPLSETNNTSRGYQLSESAAVIGIHRKIL